MKYKLICRLMAILFAALLPPVVAGAASISVPGDYKTIQEAIDRAAPEDTIVAGDGLYNENLVIRKPLSLRSANGPAAAVVMAKLKSEPAIKIADVNGVSLIGFTATGSKVSGILLSNAGGTLITDNRASNNGNGIIVYHSNGNTVTGNFAVSNESYGIYIESSSGNLIEKNSANSNDDKGFFVSYSNGNRIINNSANLNTWNGITIWSSHNNVITDNRTLRNPFGLVVSDSNNNSIEGNTTLPNIFIILPIVLIYIGILSYLVQKSILRLVYRR